MDTTSFVQIKHKKINIGWVNNKNQKILNFFEIKNHCIDAKKLQEEIDKLKKEIEELEKKKKEQNPLDQKKTQEKQDQLNKKKDEL